MVHDRAALERCWLGSSSGPARTTTVRALRPTSTRHRVNIPQVNAGPSGTPAWHHSDYHDHCAVGGGKGAASHTAEIRTPRLRGCSCSSMAELWAVGNTGRYYEGTHCLALQWKTVCSGRASRRLRQQRTPSPASRAHRPRSCWAVGQEPRGNAQPASTSRSDGMAAVGGFLTML